MCSKPFRNESLPNSIALVRNIPVAWIQLTADKSHDSRVAVLTDTLGLG